MQAPLWPCSTLGRRGRRVQALRLGLPLARLEALHLLLILPLQLGFPLPLRPLLLFLLFHLHLPLALAHLPLRPCALRLDGALPLPRALLRAAALLHIANHAREHLCAARAEVPLLRGAVEEGARHARAGEVEEDLGEERGEGGGAVEGVQRRGRLEVVRGEAGELQSPCGGQGQVRWRVGEGEGEENRRGRGGRGRGRQLYEHGGDALARRQDKGQNEARRYGG